MSIKNKIKKVNKKPKKETPNVEMKVKETPKGKVGRPTDQKEGVRYKGVSMKLPAQTILRMQLAVPKLRDLGILTTQSGLVNNAILDYLDKHKKELGIE